MAVEADEVDGLAVEEDLGVFGFYAPEAEGDGALFDGFAVEEEVDAGAVEVGLVGGPGFGVGQANGGLEVVALAATEGDLIGEELFDGGAVDVEDACLHLGDDVMVVFVDGDDFEVESAGVLLGFSGEGYVLDVEPIGGA